MELMVSVGIILNDFLPVMGTVEHEIRKIINKKSAKNFRIFPPLI